MQSMRTLKVYTYHCDALGCTNTNTVTVENDTVDPRPTTWVQVNGWGDPTSQKHYCSAGCLTHAVELTLPDKVDGAQVASDEPLAADAPLPTLATETPPVVDGTEDTTTPASTDA